MTDPSLADVAASEHLHVGPLSDHIDGFAAAMREQGYTPLTAKADLWRVAALSRWLDRCHLGVLDLSDLTIDKYLRYRRRQRPSDRGDPPLVRRLVQHLREVQVLPAAARKADEGPGSSIERDFERYLPQERGLAPTTLAYYIPLVRRFLSEQFPAGAVQLHELRPPEISRFMLRHVQSVSPGRAKLMVTALRAFFRFLRLRGEISTNLAACVPAVADRQGATLPKALAQSDVRLVLGSCDQSSVIGRRDRAILLLLARLGLRAGEVVALTLEDINWEAGVLTVSGKGAQRDELPLPKDVGGALADYLRHGRPRCLARQVFVRVRAPVRGLGSSVAVCTIVRQAIERAGLTPARKGAHLLRHSLATHMLRRGASLAEIGEVLRHRLLSTTEIYAKVDFKVLRGLARPWPGGAR